MHSLQIEQLETHYRLPASRFDERKRLDAIVAQMLETSLPAAFERIGVPSRELVCLQEIRIPLRLQISSTDEVLAQSWADELAGAIRQAEDSDRGQAASSQTNIVRYATHQDAVVDFGSGVATDNLARAWAWRQLGLGSIQETDAPSLAAEKFVSVLRTCPHFIAPTLSQLAKRGRIERLIPRLDAAQWQLLAATAAELLCQIELNDITESETNAASTGELAETQSWTARRIVEQSDIAQSIRQAGLNGTPVLKAFAVFSVIEVEPTILLRVPKDRSLLLDTLVRCIAGKQTTAPDRSDATHQSPSDGHETAVRDETNTASDMTGDASPLDVAPPGRRPSDLVDLKMTESIPGHYHPEDTFTSTWIESLQAKSNTNGENGQRDDLKSDLKPKAISENPEQAATPTSNWGGLIYLLGIVDEVDLPARIVACKTTRSRSFAWVMYQLGLLLTSQTDGRPTSGFCDGLNDDPALLTFAGARPGHNPPTANALPAVTSEMECLVRWRNRIVAGLRRRLVKRGVQFDLSPHELVTWTCLRNAEFVADQGWTEVKFSIDDVSTELRRCGIDQDPGYIPWLGIVVKYVYA